jgi:hypothetical protein
VNYTANDLRPAKDTLGGSNRMMSAREVAEILTIDTERTVLDKWREWGTAGIQSREASSMARTRCLRVDRPPDRIACQAKGIPVRVWVGISCCLIPYSPAAGRRHPREPTTSSARLPAGLARRISHRKVRVTSG